MFEAKSSFSIIKNEPFYFLSGCNARADIVFLLDSSGSVGHVDFRRIKQFAANMVSELSIGRDHTRVGLATYSSRSR